MAGKKAAVAFSGGKDSTAAALLLQSRGYQVQLLTMVLGNPGEDDRLDRVSRLASEMNLSLDLVNVRDFFSNRVIDKFLSDYRTGITPNPCIRCNRVLKFGWLRQQAFEIYGADLFATGHYARWIEKGGKAFLAEPRDRSKSQIYFLSMIAAENLKGVVFPLADFRVGEVRDMVRELPLANTEESQDVCFLAGLTLSEFLKRHDPGMFVPGDFLDMQGRFIGHHDGAARFTIGQRRGIRFSSDRKLYVVATDIARNTVTLGEDKDLFSKHVKVERPVYWRPLRPGERLGVKIRYLSDFHEAEILEAGVNRIRARFARPVRAVTPGQIAVFYENDIIVAAGPIV